MLNDEIQEAVKNNAAILGHRESAKFVKTNHAKAVIMANNVPEAVRSELEHIAKLNNSRFETFDGNSRELGTFCGKPFPVSVLAIKG